MLDIVNPKLVAPPAAKYAHAIRVSPGGERLVISGQIGVAPDGTVRQGLEMQAEQCWANILAILESQGYAPSDLVKVTTFVTVPGQAGTLRPIRDRAMSGHLCAHTYLEVAGLAGPELLVEIEAEAVKF
jgi:enamine deaminase RidA (YjgF/YER057c/UK114 family)